MVAEIHVAELNYHRKLVEQSQDIMNKWSVANYATRVPKNRFWVSNSGALLCGQRHR